MIKYIFLFLIFDATALLKKKKALIGCNALYSFYTVILIVLYETLIGIMLYSIIFIVFFYVFYIYHSCFIFYFFD